MLVSTGSEVSYSGDKDGVEMSGVETGGSGTEERIWFWACKMPCCSSGCLTVTKRDVLPLTVDDKLGCKETGAGRARRNPGCLCELLARGVSPVEEGCLDITGRKQTVTGSIYTIFGFVVAIFAIFKITCYLDAPI